MQAILLKLRGAISDPRFFDRNLFVYASRRVEQFLEAHWEEADVRHAIELLGAESEADRRSGRMDFVPIAGERAEERRAAAVAAMQQCLRANRRTPAVQALLGRIMEHGYARRDLTSQVYADVRDALVKWHDQGRVIGVFDSLPPAAQLAHLRHSESGNLEGFINAFFCIDEQHPHDVDFARMVCDLGGERAIVATDVAFEALAAARAGLQGVVMERDGVYGNPTHGLRVETNLLAL